MHIVSGLHLHRPVGMLVILQGHALRQHILLRALPAVAALVGGDTIEDGMVGNLLQVDVEGGFYAQACFVHLFSAELLFELAADFFDKPGRYGHLRLGDMQPQRSGARSLGLLPGDDLVVLHLGED